MRLGLGLTSLIMTGLLTGCVNPYPLPLNEPTEEDSVSKTPPNTDPSGKPIPNTGNQRVANPRRPGALASALAKPESQRDLKLNLLIYRDHYLKVHNDLIAANNATKDLTVGGGIIGVIGGLVKSTSTVYTGGGIAAGSSIYGQRYEFTIQALNYRKASTTMDCMLGVTAPLTETNSLSRAGVTAAAESIEEVRRKLYQAQSAVVLKDPDLKQLKESLKKENDAESAHLSAQTRIGIANYNNGNNLATEEETLVLARIDECAKSF